MTGTLYHGGVPGLRPGDRIDPGNAEHRHIDGCPICEAHANGNTIAIDPLTPEGWVYATSDRPYGRFYASRAGLGTLYRVTLDPATTEPSTEDPDFPTWRATSAVVFSVLERGVRLTMRERRRLYVRWGGTKDEAAAMIGGGHVVGRTWQP